MKKILYVILGIIGVVVLSCVSSLGYNHYVNKTNVTTEDTTVSAQVEEAVAQVYNPTFETVDDIFVFRRQLAEVDSINTVFKNIPDDALVNISKVVIGRNGHANKKSIVEEFLKNYKPIYQYIDPTTTIPQTTRSGDTIRLPASKESDTVINGQHFKLIKEVSSNE